MRQFRATGSASTGFSMVEIMVGLLIGMVSAVVIMQVFALSEGQKRAATGGSDAQTAGLIALETLERDIREAGYELGSGSLATTPMGCDIALPSGVILTDMAPVTINHAAFTGANSPDPNTDTILVVYGSGDYAPDGDAIDAAGPPYSMRSPMDFAVGDWVIASSPRGSPSVPCAANLNMTQVTSPVPCTVTSSPPTCTSTAVQVSNWAGVTPLGKTTPVLFNLGQNPVIRAYAVRGGNLTVCDFMVNDCGNSALKNNAAVWVPIADNVVSLKAQYGRDTRVPLPSPTTPPPPPPACQSLTSYCPDTWDQTTPTNACQAMRIPALRIAVVARSGQPEKDVVTTTAVNSSTPNVPSWSGYAADPLVLGPDTSADETWKHYHYKVFETVVPIRTLAYAKVEPSC